MKTQSDRSGTESGFVRTGDAGSDASCASSWPENCRDGAQDLPPLPWPALPHGQYDHFSASQMQQYAGLARANEQSEVERLLAIIRTPHNDEFYQGVSIEEEYQRQLHGVDLTDGRFDWTQYFWVAGYLLNKALAACISGEGNGEKAKHHLVTTAALLKNWHNALTGKPAASVQASSASVVAQRLTSADRDPGDVSHG
ncbi:hypothetical protein [Burkholderia glumae]|uniref:hypothetical protein n=1 Tax=Burkholderia glumae TaxID=337 RepID=UPI0020CD22C1|nr:hypothetical protein [Burkholderia glumae]MCQ0031504.1 hypothetical protein [Burkholderia glumae]MCQ0035156.1 hypothetical protein [Burkholderia glumae]MCR1769802.1 hypothetical protein [Burkholderia glumae]UVT00092.1 hypothetical protein EFP19_31075 [Burkholderia glumae]